MVNVSIIALSIMIFLLIIVLFIPLEHIIPKRNLRRLIMGLNEHAEKEQRNESISDKLIILCESITKYLRIRVTPDKYKKYKEKLILSGTFDKVSVECFSGMKIASSLVTFIFYFLLFALSAFNLNFFLMSIIMACFGYCIPDSIISGKAKKRQWQLQVELPNVLNTLAIITDAGLGFFEAIKKVCEIRKGSMVVELKKVLDEINMGILQRDALFRMSERCKVNDISVFVFTLVQSLEKGTSGVTKILKELSREVWDKRKNSARELGEKASIKLFIPMMLLVFPCLLIFIIGPAFISIIQLLG